MPLRNEAKGIAEDLRVRTVSYSGRIREAQFASGRRKVFLVGMFAADYNGARGTQPPRGGQPAGRALCKPILRYGRVFDMTEKRRLKLIACEIMFREVCLCAARSANIIDIAFMPKGLHDIGEKQMVERLQAEIDRTDNEKYEAILLCYGLCNNGIRGLHAGIPLVIPRAHDCITLLMGSRRRYKDYFDANPGTFFKSPGWIERETNPQDVEGSVTSQLGMNRTYEEYAALYGEENAEYLAEMLGGWTKHYQKIAFINTGTGDIIRDRQTAREEAGGRQWAYEELEGDLGLLTRLLEGDWNAEDFLVTPPGHSIQASGDDGVVAFSPLPG